ncbi:unnamed protein product [Leptosia nina]|uniref:Zinc finger protein 593 homolog n=1 Tax=Leptosia nina TaxID=320188 RepID=A0AAV1IYN8_9NEOP
MTYKRKKYHHGDTHLKKRWRVRNRKKDLDEIDEDLKEEKAEKLLNQDVDLDLPGAAQHYCLHCARYFIDDQALQEHFKTKVHKRRLKALELEPYTIEDSERAAGLGNFKLPAKRKIVTQNSEVLDKDGDVLRCSALFINGSKASENYAFLVPHVDFPEQLQHKDVLQNMLQKRQYKYDLDKLENLWAMYEDLKSLKLEQEHRKSQLTEQFLNLNKENASDSMEKLKIKVQLIKENLKNLKVPLWSAEEAAMVEALKLPNLLHSLTPEGENKVIYEYKTCPTAQKNHYTIGIERNLLCFLRNNTHYLKGDAAVFELGVKFYFSEFLRKNNFVQFSNPDFVKSLVVEGCGFDHANPGTTFILEHTDNTTVHQDKRLHLTGAGSLCTFLAYHAKNVIYSKVLPLKYFSMGRQYVPSKRDNSLFDVSQSSVVQLFAVSKNNEELEEILNEIVDIVKQLYNTFDHHYRLCYVAAHKLHMSESLRVGIEMYSTSLNSYVEVGHISLSGDFFSKRLMFKYTDNKEHKYPHILSGTILNVSKLLGCVLEQDQEFSVPDVCSLNFKKGIVDTL